MKPQIQHIAITTVDGSLALMQFVTESGEFSRNATDATINAEIKKSRIEAVSWRRISPNDIPRDRTNRNAWRDDGKAIVVDLTRRGRA